MRAAFAWLLVLQLAWPIPSAHALSTDGSTLPNARGLAGAVSSGAPDANADPFTGAATYGIPIEVPSGTGGMQPVLRLSYASSNRQDSWVGYGWSLGLPSIGRSLERGTPSYDDDSDVFVLGGQELVPITGPGLPREYRTKRDSFVRVVHEADGTWTVTQKDGTAQRFGLTANGRVTNGSAQVFEWLLSEQEDLHGNVFTASYQRPDPGIAYLDEIRYTLRRQPGGGLVSLNGGAPPQASVDRVVEFFLETRPDAATSYKAGFLRVLEHRLNHVDVRVSGSILRRYDLDYVQSQDSFRSLLDEVALCGTDAATNCAGSPFRTSFTYHSNVAAGTTGWAPAAWSWPSGFPLVEMNRKDMGVRIGDVDGDGLPDLMKALAVLSGEDPETASFNFSPDTGVYLNTGAGFSASASGQHPFPSFATGGGTIPVSFAWEVSGDQHSSGLTPIDLTGDGRVDLAEGLRSMDPDTGQRALLGFPEWYEADGTGWQGVSSVGDVLSSDGWGLARYGIIDLFSDFQGGVFVSVTSLGTTAGNARFGDLTGDGLPELTVRGEEWKFTWVGGAPPIFASTSPTCTDLRRSQYYFENRGHLEFVRAPLTESSPPVGCGFTLSRTSNDFQLCDLDSPNYADCGFKAGFNQTYAYKYLGDPVAPPTPWFWVSNFEQGAINLDVNADGLADLLSATTDVGFFGVVSTVFLNDGERGYSEAPGFSLPAGEFLYQYGNFANVDLGVRFSDVNGDGRPDALRGREGTSAAAWLNDGDANEGTPTPWVPAPAWELPAGLRFVDASGRDLGVRLLDVDGDGMTDVVRSFGSTTDVHLNRGDVPDLLTQVELPQGGVTTFEYAPSTQFDNTGNDGVPDLAQVVQVVSAIEVDDAVGNVHTTTFDYEDGLFDAEEREFRGFARVDAIDDTGRLTRTRYHQDDARSGLPSLEAIFAGGQLWQQMTTEYTSDSTPPYVSLPRAVTLLEWDTAAAPRRSRVVSTYDAYGNLATRTELGEWEPGTGDLDPEDNRATQIEYALNPSLHLVDRVARSRRYDGSVGEGPIVRETEFYYDEHAGLFAAPTLGELTRRVEKLDQSGKPDPTTTYAYDPYGNLTGVTNPRANAGEITEAEGTTTTEYETTYHTFPSAIMNGLGHRQEFEYTLGECGNPLPAGAGLVHVQRDSNDIAAGREWAHCYDRFGRITLESPPSHDLIMGWVYTDVPGSVRVRRVASTLNGPSATRESISHHDGFGRTILTSRSGPQGEDVLQTFAYDARGRLASQTAPHFDGSPPLTTTFEYDAVDRLTQTALPGSGRVHTVSYDRGTVTYTDPNAHVIERDFDVFGNLVEVREPDPDSAGAHLVTEYSYNALDQPMGTFDHQSNWAIIQRDKLGRKTLIADPDSGMISFGYDANGNVTEQVVKDYPNQSQMVATIEWTYDALDRRETKTLDDAAQPEVAWVYDAATHGIGLLARVSAPVGVYFVDVYDLLGRPAAERRVVGARTHHFENVYSGFGQLRTRKYPGNRTVEWVRDDRDYVTGVVLQGSGDYATGVEWDAAGRLKEWTTGAGVRTIIDYDGATDRLDQQRVIGSSTFANMIYHWDDGDRITAIDDIFDPSRDRSFDYDSLNRLTEYTGPWAQITIPSTRHYRYDAVGNMTCMAATNPSGCQNGTAFSYPQGVLTPLPHAPETIGGQAVSYDDAGNLTSFAGRTYSYDGLGQLRDVSEAGGGLVSFTYDGAGRVGKIVDHTTSETQWRVAPDFVWNQTAKRARMHIALGSATIATHDVPYNPGGGRRCGLGHEIALLLPVLAWARFTRRRRGRARAVIAVGTAGVIVVAGAAPLPLGTWLVGSAAAASPADVIYYHTDQLGSSVLVTGASGQVVDRVLYRPFGRVVPESAGPPPDAPEFGFTGQRFEPAVGLYDYGARWYDPAIAHFLQPDPLVVEPFNPQNLNRYSYVLNNPVNLVDPTGNGHVTLGGPVEEGRPELSITISDGCWTCASYTPPAPRNPAFEEARRVLQEINQLLTELSAASREAPPVILPSPQGVTLPGLERSPFLDSVFRGGPPPEYIDRDGRRRVSTRTGTAPRVKPPTPRLSGVRGFGAMDLVVDSANRVLDSLLPGYVQAQTQQALAAKIGAVNRGEIGFDSTRDLVAVPEHTYKRGFYLDTEVRLYQPPASPPSSIVSGGSGLEVIQGNDILLRRGTP